MACARQLTTILNKNNKFFEKFVKVLNLFTFDYYSSFISRKNIETEFFAKNSKYVPNVNEKIPTFFAISGEMSKSTEINQMWINSLKICHTTNPWKEQQIAQRTFKLYEKWSFKSIYQSKSNFEINFNFSQINFIPKLSQNYLYVYISNSKISRNF